MEFKKLFEPITMGSVLIKNRIAMAAMGNAGQVDSDGAFSQRSIDYFEERAKGGVGLIITGIVKVEDKLEPRVPWPFISSPRSNAVFALTELAEAVHYHDSKIFVQLTAGFGRLLPQVLLNEGIIPVGPSAVPAFWKPSVSTRPLSREEIEDLVKAFGNAAIILKRAGVDGIELHGHGGYLVDMFTAEIWNNRTDKYGGSLERRLTFAIEIVREIKASVGDEFPVTYRLPLKHYIKEDGTGAIEGERFLEKGRDIDEGLEIARCLEKAGFDGFHVDAGCYESLFWPLPPVYQRHGCTVDMAEKVKRSVKVPVICVGKIYNPELAEKILEEGKADIIALGRALLADAHWARKTRKQDMRDIRPCICCQDGCNSRVWEGGPISCTTNPACGRERIHRIVTSRTHKNVVVAGGGVAGMEAARAAATRGDIVTLYEKKGLLGGHLIAASVPSFKHDLASLLEWYYYQLQKLGVRIELNSEATSEQILHEKPQKVIIATGSRPAFPNIPGFEMPIVSTCIDLLLGNKKAGDTVVVLGGGFVGCETALWLALEGKQVMVIEKLPEMLAAEFYAKRQMLLHLLELHGVKLMSNATIEEIGDEKVTVTSSIEGLKVIKCDTVALAIGLKPQEELLRPLQEKNVEVYAIGDCRKPRKIMNAIWEGFKAGGFS